MKRRTFIAATAILGCCLALAPAFASSFKTYDAQSFSKAVAAGPVVVHVYADWCPVCKAQQPTLSSLTQDPRLAKVQFITVNFDKDKEFLRSNKIANQSVIVVFKGGKEVERLSGTTDPAQIRDGILKAI